MNKKVKYRGAITVMFIVLWLYFFVSNISIVGDTYSKLVNSEIDLLQVKEELLRAYNDNLAQKYTFINLNGLYVRLSGGRVCNKMIRLNNGYLSEYGEAEQNIQNKAKSIKALYQELEEKKIDFVYVQCPYKIDMNNELLPYGAEDKTNKNTNALVKRLKKSQVPVLDLRESISDTPDHVSEYFYKTDHHWNSLGAFRGFQEISKYLQAIYPEEKIYGEYQKLDNWDVHKKNNWSLGSGGKRTGVYFTGTDDLVWLTPKFETEMSFANVYKNEFYTGDFCDANIREKYIEERDYFADHAYCVYVGGNYPLILHRNDKAPVDKRVLLVKDSFALPLETYLSTVFSEVDTIDLRHYKGGTLYEYILESEPDTVIMSYNPSAIAYKSMFEYGIKSISDDCGINALEPVYQKDVLEIKSDDSKSYKCKVIYKDFEPGKTYHLECDSVKVEEGSARGISLKLSDKNKDVKYDCSMWDIDYCTKNSSFEWTFTVPTDGNEPMLLIYCGIAGQTEGNNIVFKGLRLYRE